MSEVDSNAVISNENPEITNENSQDSTNKTKLSGDLKDYKLIVDLTRDMKNSLNDARNQIQNSLKNEGYVVPDVLEDMVLLTNDDIETGDIDKLLTYLEDHFADNHKFEEKFIKATEEEIRDSLRDIRKTFRMVHSIEKEYHDIIKESKDILEEYFNYINSNRVDESIKKRLDVMKSINDIDDVSESDKKQNEKLIKTLEKTLDLSFITDGLNIDRVVEVFFKDNLSSYVVTKFKNKIKKYGYNTDIYLRFFDIEENFLDEKYHPFNNLFLFIYMRYVGYSDPYNKDDGLYVRSITGNIANLIYHRFDTTDSEKEFIKFIELVLDKFIEAGYTDIFIMDNTSYKNNADNVRARAVMEEQKRDLVTRKLKYYNIEYSDDMSLDELMALFDDNYNALEEKVLEEEPIDEDSEDDIAKSIDERFKIDDINNAIDNIRGVDRSEDEDISDSEEDEESDDDIDDSEEDTDDENIISSEESEYEDYIKTWERENAEVEAAFNSINPDSPYIDSDDSEEDEEN